MPSAIQQLFPWESSALQQIAEARHHDPFSVLGSHRHGTQTWVLCSLPDTLSASIGKADHPTQRLGETDFFAFQCKTDELETHYTVVRTDANAVEHRTIDPYTFAPQVGDLDLHLFSEGRHWHAYRFLGAQAWEVDGIRGALFATWAPNAERVSIIGDFNRWDGRIHPMRARGNSGVWELFLPDVAPGAFL